MFFKIQSFDTGHFLMDESTDPNDFSIAMTAVGELDQFAVGMVDQTNGAITTYMFSMIPNTPMQDGD